MAEDRDLDNSPDMWQQDALEDSNMDRAAEAQEDQRAQLGRELRSQGGPWTNMSDRDIDRTVAKASAIAQTRWSLGDSVWDMVKDPWGRIVWNIMNDLMQTESGKGVFGEMATWLGFVDYRQVQAAVQEETKGKSVRKVTNDSFYNGVDKKQSKELSEKNPQLAKRLHDHVNKVGSDKIPKAYRDASPEERRWLAHQTGQTTADNVNRTKISDDGTKLTFNDKEYDTTNEQDVQQYLNDVVGTPALIMGPDEQARQSGRGPDGTSFSSFRGGGDDTRRSVEDSVRRAGGNLGNPSGSGTPVNEFEGTNAHMSEEPGIGRDDASLGQDAVAAEPGLKGYESPQQEQQIGFISPLSLYRSPSERASSTAAGGAASSGEGGNAGNQGNAAEAVAPMPRGLGDYESPKQPEPEETASKAAEVFDEADMDPQEFLNVVFPPEVVQDMQRNEVALLGKDEKGWFIDQDRLEEYLHEIPPEQAAEIDRNLDGMGLTLAVNRTREEGQETSPLAGYRSLNEKTSQHAEKHSRAVEEVFAESNMTPEEFVHHILQPQQGQEVDEALLQDMEATREEMLAGINPYDPQDPDAVARILGGEESMFMPLRRFMERHPEMAGEISERAENQQQSRSTAGMYQDMNATTRQRITEQVTDERLHEAMQQAAEGNPEPLAQMMEEDPQLQTLMEEQMEAQVEAELVAAQLMETYQDDPERLAAIMASNGLLLAEEKLQIAEWVENDRQGDMPLPEGAQGRLTMAAFENGMVRDEMKRDVARHQARDLKAMFEEAGISEQEFADLVRGQMQDIGEPTPVVMRQDGRVDPDALAGVLYRHGDNPELQPAAFEHYIQEREAARGRADEVGQMFEQAGITPEQFAAIIQQKEQDRGVDDVQLLDANGQVDQDKLAAILQRRKDDPEYQVEALGAEMDPQQRGGQAVGNVGGSGDANGGGSDGSGGGDTETKNRAEEGQPTMVAGAEAVVQPDGEALPEAELEEGEPALDEQQVAEVERQAAQAQLQETNRVLREAVEEVIAESDPDQRIPEGKREELIGAIAAGLQMQHPDETPEQIANRLTVDESQPDYMQQMQAGERLQVATTAKTLATLSEDDLRAMREATEQVADEARAATASALEMSAAQQAEEAKGIAQALIDEKYYDQARQDPAAFLDEMERLHAIDARERAALEAQVAQNGKMNFYDRDMNLEDRLAESLARDPNARALKAQELADVRYEALLSQIDDKGISPKEIEETLQRKLWNEMPGTEGLSFDDWQDKPSFTDEQGALDKEKMTRLLEERRQDHGMSPVGLTQAVLYEREQEARMNERLAAMQRPSAPDAPAPDAPAAEVQTPETPAAGPDAPVIEREQMTTSVSAVKRGLRGGEVPVAPVADADVEKIFSDRELNRKDATVATALAAAAASRNGQGAMDPQLQETIERNLDAVKADIGQRGVVAVMNDLQHGVIREPEPEKTAEVKTPPEPTGPDAPEAKEPPKPKSQQVDTKQPKAPENKAPQPKAPAVEGVDVQAVASKVMERTEIENKPVREMTEKVLVAAMQNSDKTRDRVAGDIGASAAMVTAGASAADQAVSNGAKDPKAILETIKQGLRDAFNGRLQQQQQAPQQPAPPPPLPPELQGVDPTLAAAAAAFGGMTGGQDHAGKATSKKTPDGRTQEEIEAAKNAGQGHG